MYSRRGRVFPIGIPNKDGFKNNTEKAYNQWGVKII